jgi:hypothetical protein
VCCLQYLTFVYEGSGKSVKVDPLGQELAMLSFFGPSKHGGAYYVHADGEDAFLGSSPVRHFMQPSTTSRYGRHDIDAVQTANGKRDGPPANKAQTPVEAVRWGIRHFSKAECVVSVGNGTGTGCIAAMVEGQSCIGIDIDRGQHEVAVSRVEVFASMAKTIANTFSEDDEVKAMAGVHEPFCKLHEPASNLCIITFALQ